MLAPAPMSVASTATATLSTRLPMLRLDLAPAQFGRGDKEPQVRVVGRDFSPFRALVSRAIEFPAAEFERPSTDRAEGLHDPKSPLRRRELDGGLDLNDLRADEVAEPEHVASALGVLFRHVRDVSRPFRFTADLAGPSMDRDERRARRHPATIV